MGQHLFIHTVEELEEIIERKFEDFLQKLLPLLKQEKKEEEEKVLSRQNLANMFKVSLVTIDKWSAQGVIKKHYLGSKAYFKYSEVMSSLEKNNFKKYTNSK